MAFEAAAGKAAASAGLWAAKKVLSRTPFERLQARIVDGIDPMYRLTAKENKALLRFIASDTAWGYLVEASLVVPIEFLDLIEREVLADRSLEDGRRGLAKQIASQAKAELPAAFAPELGLNILSNQLRDASDRNANNWETVIDSLRALGERRADAPDEFSDGLDQEMYAAEKRRNYIGRQWLFDYVATWLRDASSEPALLIVGEPGVGKSAFVAELVARARGKQAVAYHFCTREDRRSLEAGTLVQNIVHMLREQMPALDLLLNNEATKRSLGEARDYPGRALDDALITAISRLSPQDIQPVIIAVDALDEADIFQSKAVSDDANIATLLATRLQRLPNSVKIVATARSNWQTMEQFSDLRAYVLDAQSSKNKHDLQEFVAQQVRDRLAPSCTTSIVDDIVDVSNGNFLYAAVLLRSLERGLISPGSIRSLPAGMAGFYSRCFRRMVSDSEAVQQANRTVLQLLVAAQGPLSLNLIERAANIDGYAVAAALSSISVFLRESDGGFVLFHKSLRDWLVDPHSSFYVNPRAGHMQLAAEYVDTLQCNGPLPRQELSDTPGLSYRARYGLDHLVEVGTLVSRAWNPRALATIVAAGNEHSYAVGGEAEHVPVFARRYVSAALAGGNSNTLVNLILLLARVAVVHYSDAGLLRIEVDVDGTWKLKIIGPARDPRSLGRALSASAWAGAIANSVIAADASSPDEIAAVVEPLRTIADLASGLEYAGWSPMRSIADRGDFLSRDLYALMRACDEWQKDDDEILRATISGGVRRAALDLSRPSPRVLQRANQLGLSVSPDDVERYGSQNDF